MTKKEGECRMAEFCLDCWNRLNGFHKTERDYILSDEPDLCEGCGRFCRVVERERSYPVLYDLRRWMKRKK